MNSKYSQIPRKHLLNTETTVQKFYFLIFSIVTCVSILEFHERLHLLALLPKLYPT